MLTASHSICQLEIASSAKLLDAMLGALHEPMPALSAERRALVLEACARCVARSPPPHRLEAPSPSPSP